METLDVTITEDGRQSGGELKLKFVWGYRAVRTLPYSVPARLLKDRAKAVRAALQRLIDSGMRNGGRLGRCGAELREVAVAGQNLYRALFRPGDGYDANVIREWVKQTTDSIRAEGGKVQISCVIDTLAHIPWGLVYDGPLEELSGDPEQDAIEHYEDFWSLKFSLTSIYWRILPDGLGAPDPSIFTEVLCVRHGEVFEEARPHLVQPQDRVLEWVEETFGRSLESSTELFQAWRAVGAQSRLLYIYCHADDENLLLSPDDSIGLSDFRDATYLDVTPRRSTCVVFLNGCTTAVGNPDGAFLVATAESVFSGFVGTETKIPDVFALRFGLAFLYCFLQEGWPIFQIMDHLRRQHWPLALTYSTYCPAHLRYGAAEKSLDLQHSDNYSRMPLGTDKL